MAMMKKLTDLQQLSVDLYNGKVDTYSVKEAEDKLRGVLVDAVGGVEGAFPSSSLHAVKTSPKRDNKNRMLNFLFMIIIF